MKKILVFLLLCSFLAASAGTAEAAVNNPYNLKRYIAPDGSFAMFKPADWSVSQGKQPGMLYVDVTDPQKTSIVTLSYCPSGTAFPTSLHFMNTTLSLFKKIFPDVAVSNIMATKDKLKSCCTVSFKDRGVTSKGKYYFTVSGSSSLMLGYRAPAQKLASSKGLLLTIASNIAMLNQSAYVQARKNAPSMGQAYQPIQVQCAWRQASDGSSKMIVPVGWEFLAAKGQVLTCSKDGNWGFVFTTVCACSKYYGVTTPDVIQSQWMSPDRFLPVILNHFKTGYNVQIMDHRSDNASNYQFQVFVGRQCVAEDIEARYVTRSNTTVLGAFKLINSGQGISGHWYSIMTGFWAPEKEFYRYADVLAQIGESFAIDDEYAKAYIRSGLQNLARLKAKTAAAIADLNNARAENQRAWEERQKVGDYIDWNRSQYIRGETDWVSNMEGGKVYHTDSWGTTDTQTGDQYTGPGYNNVNFDGSNPRYNETMQQINGYDMWKKYNQ
ncbi:MAG: hypothetical protein AB9903_22125 [Vulcanimicrobiota bacterium]